MKRIRATWYCAMLYQMLLWGKADFHGVALCCTRCRREVGQSVLALRYVVTDVAVRWGWVSCYCGMLYQMLLWSEAECLVTAVCCTRCCCEVRQSVLLLRYVVPDVAVRWGRVSWYCGMLYQMLLWSEAECIGTAVCCTRCCCDVRESALLLRYVVPDVAVMWERVPCYCGMLYQMLLWCEAECLGTAVCCTSCCCKVRQSVLVLRTRMYLFSLTADDIWFMEYCVEWLWEGKPQAGGEKPLPLSVLPPGTRLAVDLLNWFGLRS
jgi:hypothetical protein